MDDLDYTSSDGSEGSVEDTDTEEQPEARSTGAAQDIYRREELHERLEEISWEGASVLDTQVATCSTDDIPDIEDDLQRELTFYNQALGGARSVIQSMEEAGAPWHRPPDFYAEMVKSDGHMSRIKEQLMFEQRKIEEAEERRKMREAKRASKQIQAARLKEKAQAKKANIAQMDRLRKQRQRSGFAGELDMEATLASMDKPRSKNGAQRISERRTPISKRREAKNSKFGFGGRKRLSKQNDAYSAANMDGYKGSGRKSGRGKGTGKGQLRPGKSKRAAAKAKR